MRKIVSKCVFLFQSLLMVVGKHQKVGCFNSEKSCMQCLELKILNFFLEMNTENLTWENKGLINSIPPDYKIEVVFRIQNLEAPFKKYLQVTSTV